MGGSIEKRGESEGGREKEKGVGRYTSVRRRRAGGPLEKAERSEHRVKGK